MSREAELRHAARAAAGLTVVQKDCERGKNLIVGGGLILKTEIINLQKLTWLL